MFYYAEIDGDGVCYNVQQLATETDKGNLIPINTLNIDLLGQKWTGSEWTPPEENHDEPALTIADLKAQIQEQQEQLAEFQEIFIECITDIDLALSE